MNRPTIIGLTGSIGMGKSTVAEMFMDAGVPVFDADAEVRQMQGPKGDLIEPIEAAFPGSTGPAGVDRDALGKLVFADQDKLAVLEKIVHPAVAAKREAFLATHVLSPFVVFDIPLLFERGGHDTVDFVAVVSASPEKQRKRVLARPGMTLEKFEHILALQIPDAQKREKADFVIDTGTTLEKTRGQVEQLVKTLTARHSSCPSSD